MSRVLPLGTVVAVLALACDRDAPLASPAVPPLDVVAPPGYQAVELGSLGGGFTDPADLDDRGRVVGSSSGTDGQIHAFIWEDEIMSQLPRSPQTPAFMPTHADAINRDGAIAGLEDRNGQVLSWSSATAVPDRLSYQPQSEFTRVLGLNDRGDILVHTFAIREEAILFRDGVEQNLGGLDLPGPYTVPRAWDGRKIVGRSRAVQDGPTDWFHAFLWEGGTMRDLGIFGPGPCRDIEGDNCADSEATDINDRGVVVGWGTVPSQGFITRAFRWDGRRGLRDLGAYPGFQTMARLINDRGEIVGTATEPDPFREFTFFLSRGEPQDIGSLGGGGTSASHLTNRGEILGTSLTASGERHGFLWQDGVMLDLGAGRVVDVNRDGDILMSVGDGFSANQGVLLRRTD